MTDIKDIVCARLDDMGIPYRRYRHEAADYAKPGSLNLSVKRDLYLYSTVSRQKKEQPKSGGGSTTHRSSSGAIHGGRGGKF